MKNLRRSYEKLTTTLQVSYENVKFAAIDVIRETLCQRLLLVKYFKLKITDNQSDDFLRMLSENDLPFSEENLRKSYLADLQKTWKSYDELAEFVCFEFVCFVFSDLILLKTWRYISHLLTYLLTYLLWLTIHVFQNVSVETSGFILNCNCNC